MLFTSQFNKLLWSLKRKLNISHKRAYHLALEAFKETSPVDGASWEFTTNNALFIEALALAVVHNASVKVIPFNKYSNFPKRRYALELTVDRIGADQRSRMSHPLFCDIVEAFPFSKKDEDGDALRYRDYSDSKGRSPDKKRFILTLC
jgi:hypothetical protein